MSAAPAPFIINKPVLVSQVYTLNGYQPHMDVTAVDTHLEHLTDQHNRVVQKLTELEELYRYLLTNEPEALLRYRATKVAERLDQ